MRSGGGQVRVLPQPDGDAPVRRGRRNALTGPRAFPILTPICIGRVQPGAHGYGYEISSADVWAPYSIAMKIAERVGKADDVRADIRRTALSVEDDGNLVARVLGRELGLPPP